MYIATSLLVLRGCRPITLTMRRNKTIGRGAYVPAGNKAIRDRTSERMERYMQRTVDMLSHHTNVTKKPWNYTAGPMSSASSMVVGKMSSGGGRVNERRARQLSVVFQEQITSLVNSGEICPRLLDLGFEISKVRMLSDCGQLNVYWIASGLEERDKEIVDLLPSVASQLRAALSGLRIVGNVPSILFVKDDSIAQLQEVERLLKIADMGPKDFQSDQSLDELQDEEGPSQGADDKTVQSRGSIQENIEALGRSFERSESRGLVRPDGVVEILRRPTNASSLPDGSNLKDRPSECGSSVGGEDTAAFIKNARSDIYGLDYEKIVERVLRAKRKTESESKIGRDDDTGLDSDSEKAGDSSNVNKIPETKFKVNSRALRQNDKQRRLFRNADSVLSSLHHRNENTEFDARTRSASNYDDSSRPIVDPDNISK